MDLTVDSIAILLGAVVPGTVAMWGLSFLSPTVRGWLTSPEQQGNSIGGAVLFLVTSLAAGLVADAIRLHSVDTVHYLTGVSRPEYSFADLDETKFGVFKGVMENHYHYHEFYGNAFVCILFAYLVRQSSTRRWPWPPTWREFITSGLLVVTWMASRTHLAATNEAIREIMS